MFSNPLMKISELGQSIWFDNISKGLIESGKLRRLIIEDDIKGVTSNPTIFEKAISSGSDYDAFIESLLKKNPDLTVATLYEKLIIRDIQDGADVLRSIYDETNGLDGYISVEVSPELAYKQQETIDEAKYLWEKINRPNLMIKVPATKEGVFAVRNLIGEGINVNVTLMFSMNHYKSVVEAYLSGLEDRLKKDGDIQNISSVASFFVSRVDTVLDKILTEKGINDLQGKIAVANSKMVYQFSQDIYSSERFKKIEEKGAKKQRLLWASTGTKSPDYSDVLYVEELIGADTVNTVPPATLNAFRDHGLPAETLTKDINDAKGNLEKINNLNIILDELTEQLQVDGVKAFVDSFRSLMNVLEAKYNLISEQS